MPLSIRAQLCRGLMSGLRIVAGIVALGVTALYIWQGLLIWHPRPYARGEAEAFPLPLAALAFHTVQGSQTAFYARPRAHNGRRGGSSTATGIR